MKTKMWKKYIVVLLILIAIFVVGYFVASPIVAFAITIIAVLFFAVWNNQKVENFYTKKIKDCETIINKQSDEISNLRNRHIEVSDVKNTFKISLAEINAQDVRPYNYFIDANQNKKFIGTLKIDIKAQYGIDVEELLFNYDGNTLHVSNIHPKFLSYSSRSAKWINEITLEKVSPNLLGRLMNKEEYWRTRDKNDKITMQESERLRMEAEEQLNNQGPETTDWIRTAIYYKTVECLKIIFHTEKIELTENHDDTYRPLNDFLREYNTHSKVLESH